MNTWIDESHSTVSAVPLPANHRADRGLRLMDLVLALLACGPLLVPALLLLAVGRLRSQRLVGRYNAVFKRWHFEFPDSTLGRWLQGSGLAQLPTVWSILKGDMAWVGPQAHAADGELDCHPALATLRPGWVSIWQLQQRTAVHFGTELESDLRYARVRGVRHDAGVLLRSALTLWMAAPRAADQERVCIGDVEFDNVDMRQALERISRMLDGNRTQQVSFVNPACINIAAGNRAYRRVLARAALVLPDGIGVKIAADVMRSPLRQNVNGTDLFPRLCDVLEARGARLFLLGGQAGVAQKVARVVRKHWPRLRVVGVRDGFFSLAEEGEVAAQVRASGADIVLVARGVPMQDLFIDRHLHQLGVKVAMGVGGLFDFVSGRIDRAPRWMRDSGLEWIYRLMQEPSRMWRRYIIGNFTFLLRVGLQRLGLRASATDLSTATAKPVGFGSGNPQGTRVVLMASATAGQNLPVSDDYPNALMPFGWTSFIEKNLDQLADAGIREVDLVVNSQPEQLRQLLADGERWGMRLKWHTVKDASTPYSILPSLGLGAHTRVVLGHADQWIETSALHALLEQDQVLATAELHGLAWSGWCSVAPAALAAISTHCDQANFAATMCNAPVRLRLLEQSHFASARSARELMKAQQLALAQSHLDAVPATWIRTPWGAHAPDAVVQVGAELEGPALIGPRCYVSAGARIGAGTILTHDVVVSPAASVSHSVVLPHTLVGEGLELEDCIVNAGRFHNVRLDAHAYVASADGLLLDLQRKPGSGVPWVSRLVAAVLCLVLLPWIAIDALLGRLAGKPARWSKRNAVTGRDEISHAIRQVPLRCPKPGQKGVAALLSQYGAWLDVALGLRSWFGQRPRSQSEWYALSRDWQTILSAVPVGCLHAPAWTETGESAAESEAVADVYFAYNNRFKEKLRILVRSGFPGKRSLAVRIP